MIPLTVRSHYSLMRGTASVQRICRAARRMGYDRLALTDTDNLYGLWPFLAACRREGITPIVGAEVSEPQSRRRGICLVENARGYRNLCRLLTRRHLKPDFRLQTALPPLARGLTVLTPDPGLLKHWHAVGVRVAASMPRRPL
ncbi:MAG: PHP domain-containing protein, partial [Desulfosarcina sp.]|nr:PHP domain-containing protein [Desulfobacterales bacterium]